MTRRSTRKAVPRRNAGRDAAVARIVASEGVKMAKPNYAFAKRQRDIAKKQKKEAKRQRKTDERTPPAQEDLPQPAVDGTTVV